MKSTGRILAQRYARAYDGLSNTAAQAESACAALAAAAGALRAAADYMCDPAVSSAQKTAFVRSLKLAEKQVEHFVCALLEAKRYYLLNLCAEEVQKLTDKRLGKIHARVETAFELSDAQKKQVTAALSAFSGAQAQAQFEVNAGLLGGLKVRMGDTLIDGSLQGKFKKLEAELTK